MNIPFLITILIVNSNNAVDVSVSVNGTLSCLERFYYRITLWEQDSGRNNPFARLQNKYSIGTTAQYEVSGEASDAWFRDEVQLLMTIEHSCESVYSCVCKDFGEITTNFEWTLDIDLESTDLPFCELCNDPRSEEFNSTNV